VRTRLIKTSLLSRKLVPLTNSAIVELREHVVISLVDGLKIYITNRIVRLRDYILRYNGEICPMIIKLLDKCKKEAEGWPPN